MGSLGFCRDDEVDGEELKPTRLELMYLTKQGDFRPRAYCTCFFALMAASVAGLRVLGRFADGLGGEPLLQSWWTASTQQHAWLLSHQGFGALVAFAAYMVSCLYFTSLDLRRSMETKVQKQYFPSVREMLVAGLPQIAIYWLANHLWYFHAYRAIELPARAPTLAALAEEVVVAFVVGDFLIYWEHRLMHAFRFTRVHIHSWHHAYTAPFSWAGGVVHPLEDLVVVACQVAAPMVLGHHPLAFWVFVALWTVLLVEEHSGHDVVWAPYNWLPFTRSPMGGGAAPHDIHHYKVRAQLVPPRPLPSPPLHRCTRPPCPRRARMRASHTTLSRTAKTHPSAPTTGRPPCR